MTLQFYIDLTSSSYNAILNDLQIQRDLFSLNKIFSLEYRREWVNEVYTRGATFYLIDYKKNVDLATWLQKTAFYISKEYVVKIVCVSFIMYFCNQWVGVSTIELSIICVATNFYVLVKTPSTWRYPNFITFQYEK